MCRRLADKANCLYFPRDEPLRPTAREVGVPARAIQARILMPLLVVVLVKADNTCEPESGISKKQFIEHFEIMFVICCIKYISSGREMRYAVEISGVIII